MYPDREHGQGLDRAGGGKEAVCHTQGVGAELRAPPAAKEEISQSPA